MFTKINTEKDNHLVEAYVWEDLSGFKNLIKEGYNVNCLNNDGCSLISAVIENRHSIKNNKKFFDELISSNVYLGKIGKEDSLLYIAMLCCDDIYYLEKILENGVDVNDKITDDLKTFFPIFYSLTLIDQDNKDNKNVFKKFPKFEALLKHNPDLNIKNKIDQPLLIYMLLHTCDVSEFNYIAPTLVEKGIDVGEVSELSQSCFHILGYMNKQQESMSMKIALNFLLKNGLDINAGDCSDRTPLMIASLFHNVAAVQFYIENKADINMIDNIGQTALIKSGVYCNDLQVINTLIDAGADVSVVDKHGSNVALYVADRISQIKEPMKNFMPFFEKHVDLLDVKNNKGICALDIIFKTHKKEHKKLKQLINNNSKIIN